MLCWCYSRVNHDGCEQNEVYRVDEKSRERNCSFYFQVSHSCVIQYPYLLPYDETVSGRLQVAAEPHVGAKQQRRPIAC